MHLRALVSATLLAWALLPAMALLASADEDPPPARADAGPPIRPPLSVLRAVAIPAAPAPTAAPKKELIVLVGGYGSVSDPNVFDAFRARIAQQGGYEVVRFGEDFGTYDTFGALDDNAGSLRDAVRSKAPDYTAVHIVAHSMGGNVADRAFSLGLSSSDGVSTYVAWAAPHDGARVARATQATLTFSGPAREDTRAVARLIQEPDTPAARDLAAARAVAPPSGVARLDLRLATDWMVSSGDARDPGVDSRILLPRSPMELEGHGGILRSDQALDLTMATIKAKAVPPDGRGALLRAASEVIVGGIATEFDLHAAMFLLGFCGTCFLLGCALNIARRSAPWPLRARPLR
ncbi:MAG TPA: hypothetical protein VGQ86_03690 [Candidatus Limnocylindria bacterium]|nr:hypothetical protein [Candidatus Limnocylindria bacterium]